MAMREHVDRIGAIRDRIRALLEDERRRLNEQIRSYPTPIPRCDQQFNHLIARREGVCSEMARLDAAGSRAAADDGGAWLDAFIAASACLEADAKLRLKAALCEGPVAEVPHVPGS